MAKKTKATAKKTAGRKVKAAAATKTNSKAARPKPTGKYEQAGAPWWKRTPLPLPK